MSRRIKGQIIGVSAILLFGVIGALLATASSKVFAAPTQPATDWSFYMYTLDTGTANTLGCNQGKFDASASPYRNSEVVLDFGGEDDSNGDTKFINGVYANAQEIEAIAYQFALGYWSCTASDSTSVIRLGIGTNNSFVSS